MESFLQDRYTIGHDGLKRYLQQKEVFYQEARLSGWDLIPQGEESFEDLPRFEIIEHTVRIQNQEGRLYGIRIER